MCKEPGKEAETRTGTGEGAGAGTGTGARTGASFDLMKCHII